MSLVDKLPWWGLLVRAPLTETRALVAAVITELEATAMIGSDSFDRSTHLFVAGDGEWCAMLHYLDRSHEGTKLADAIRALGVEVEILWLDDFESVWYWAGSEWLYYDRENARPDGHAHSRGIILPSHTPKPLRETRAVALIEGAEIDEVRGLVDDRDHVVSAPRGTIVFGESRVAYDQRLVCTRAFKLLRYLDDGSFHCAVIESGNVRVFTVPESGGTGLERLPNVEGETDPRRILAVLGIPEEALFPPDGD